MNVADWPGEMNAWLGVMTVEVAVFVAADCVTVSVAVVSSAVTVAA